MIVDLTCTDLTLEQPHEAPCIPPTATIRTVEPHGATLTINTFKLPRLLPEDHTNSCIYVSGRSRSLLQLSHATSGSLFWSEYRAHPAVLSRSLLWRSRRPIRAGTWGFERYEDRHYPVVTDSTVLAHFQGSSEGGCPVLTRLCHDPGNVSFFSSFFCVIGWERDIPPEINQAFLLPSSLSSNGVQPCLPVRQHNQV